MIPLEHNPLYALSMAIWDYCLDEVVKLKIAIDIGANEGGYTHMLVQHGYHVTAFEPVPDMFEKLHERYKNDARVMCHQKGVSDKNDTIKNVTVLEAWTIGNPRTVPLAISPTYRGHQMFDMHTVTLDNLEWPNGVGFIKLDVDGYEHKVLRGAWQLLTTYQPPILCEFGKYISKVGDDPKAFVNDIFKLGYHVFSMDGKHRFTTWEQIEPCYPFDTTFDVMLIPSHMSDAVLERFNK